MLQSEGKLIDRTDTELLEVLRERTFFVLAEKYSTTPQSIRGWSDYDYKRALLFLNAEGERKFSEDDVEEAKERRSMAAKSGFILDHDFTFWGRYLSDEGELDTEGMEKGGYSPEQHSYIREQMAELGWLGEGSARDTAPLPTLSV